MADPQPIDDASDIMVVVEGETAHQVRTDPLTGTVEIDQPDGGVVVQLNPPRAAGLGPTAEDPAKFYRNLVGEIEDGQLSIIAETLIDQITVDDNSRTQALQDRARAMDLLGLKIEGPRSDAGDSAASGTGWASVTNPLLLENCLKGWATAVGELLPAEGPAKIDNEGEEGAEADELADAFERDFNWYLTTGAPEYMPDTSQMLLWGTYFGGSGFKKIYVCPLRRRPVSDSVDMKDMIVSDTTKDLGACERITHQMMIRPSKLKRLQARGYYRDTPMVMPSAPAPNVVDEKIAGIQGTQTDATKQNRPEDTPFVLWETQCELNLAAFAPKEFADRDIALPFLVTLEKDSRTVLAIRRDWKPEDEDCARKRMYVKYPYIPGPGFFGTGMLNLLGNSSQAMTAAWREALDTGMAANFPGGLIAKAGARQNSSTLTPRPGEFTPVETGGLPIRDAIMEMPYKDVTPGLMSLMDKILGQAEKVGTAAEVPIGEGIQNVPVGTMMAHIEQATKIMSAAHKGMHRAQSEELQLLADLFREDPEAFWRGNKKARNYWDEQKLLLALENYDLVPKSDPNVPSHVHRMMKVLALGELAASPVFGPKLDIDQILDRILVAIKENPMALRKKVDPNAPPPPPSPDEIAAQAKMTDAQTKARKQAAEEQQHTADQEMEQKKIDAALQDKTVDLARDLVIHANDAKNADRSHVLDANRHALDVAKHAHDATMDMRDAMRPEPEPKT